MASGKLYLIVGSSIRPEDFPGDPVAKTPHFQYRGPGFELWSGN